MLEKSWLIIYLLSLIIIKHEIEIVLNVVFLVIIIPVPLIFRIRVISDVHSK